LQANQHDRRFINAGDVSSGIRDLHSCRRYESKILNKTAV
jgi:hypothetical protein